MEIGTNLNVAPSFVFDFYRPTHLRPILHCIATLHNAAEKRQTHIAIGIGCLCGSIGDLIAA